MVGESFVIIHEWIVERIVVGPHAAPRGRSVAGAERGQTLNPDEMKGRATVNFRPVILIAALVMLGGGLVWVLSNFWQPTPVVLRVPVAVAASQIEPYTIITQAMIKAGEPMEAGAAYDRGAYPIESVVGLMSTDQIRPGALLTGVNAKPVDEVRFVEDFGLEVVTFAAGVDRTVGGQLRPGHVINLYGYGQDRETRQPFTTLIEPRLWVVRVSAGGQPVSSATARPDLETGEYREDGGDRTVPSSLITVAVPPNQAYHIIDALGAQGLSAWASLAANQTVDLRAMATAVPLRAPTPGPDWPATLESLGPVLMPTAKIAETGYGGMAR